MMQVRLARLNEIDEVLDMAAADVAETRPSIEFDRDRAASIFFRYMADANPTIYVIDDEGDLIGFGLAWFNQYSFAYGHFLSPEVLYVRPEKRGTRAAALLLKHIVNEAIRLDVEEIIGGNDNGFNSDRTARFLEHFGFKRVGYSLRWTNDSPIRRRRR